MARTVVKWNFKSFILQKQAELDRQFKQKELAEMLDVSEHTISAWMRGDVEKVDLQNLGRVLDVFECGLDDILKVERVEN